jgi:hypothetical protein
LNSLANELECFSKSIVAQFFIIYAGNFDVDVNSVEQGPRDVLLIFGNDSRYRLLCISEIATWIGVYGCDDG